MYCRISLADVPSSHCLDSRNKGGNLIASWLSWNYIEMPVSLFRALALFQSQTHFNVECARDWYSFHLVAGKQEMQLLFSLHVPLAMCAKYEATICKKKTT